MKTALTLATLITAVLLSGCNTISSRIKEKAPVFAGLDAATQEKLRQGKVEIGYTPDMVYIALGSPDQKSRTLREEAQDEVWIYNTYYQDYVGTKTIGYRRVVVEDKKDRQPIIYLEPITYDFYQTRIEEDIRVGFHDGKVAVIETAKKK